MTDDVGTRRTDLVPAAAGLLRDFVNTAEPQTGGETLVSGGVLTGWCREHGLVGPDVSLTEEHLSVAVEVREGLRAVLQAHAGHAAPAAARSALENVLERVPLRATFDDEGDLRLAPAEPTPVASMVAGLVDAVRAAEQDGSWERLKVCAKDSCRWAFYDTSRNRSGRWCSMAGCGNQVKMQRAHARRRQAEAGGDGE